MRFSKQLRDVADAFRKENLDSTDAADKTQMDDDWTKNKVPVSRLKIHDSLKAKKNNNEDFNNLKAQ